MIFSGRHRYDFISQLCEREYDLLVIGGGITGCGIALDAALRGMKVALVEKDDFASGTSSRSTKLIHGGLRYLKQLEFKLVRDVGRERAVAHRNARHVVIPEQMLLPIAEGGSLGKFSTSIGLLIYDLLAGVKKSEQRRMLDRHATARQEPLLRKDGLSGGGLYYEYRTDDARLVIELAKSAFRQGAVLLHYAEATRFLYTNGKVNGAVIEDRINGGSFEVKARVVVNAGGPWVDIQRKKDNSLKGKRLQLTKGVHIVFPYSKLPLKQAAYFDVGDGRMIFAIPRNGITYVGTTDTIYNQDIDHPHCTKADAEYLLAAVRHMFPDTDLTLSDIESTWAGLRPLIHEDGKSPSELSRKDEIIISESGLVSIAGGKLTGYRLMAEKIVDLAAKRTGKPFGVCHTKNHRLCGGEFDSEQEFLHTLSAFIKTGAAENIPQEIIENWFFRYGKNTTTLIQNLERAHQFTANANLIFDTAELLYACEHEMVFHLNDYLIRRSGRLFFEKPATEKKLEDYASLLQLINGLTEEKKNLMLQETLSEFRNVVSF